ncbi:MAG: NADP-specific glutamate dehydrogenase GdhA [Desulfobacteraceae bacterium]|nr:NADP-specific glutamate dehydrogenase GdhA [Desulfobacteraceae bacterium]
MNNGFTGSVSQAPHIIDKAENVGLDLRVLYEAVIDLSSEGLITANCINMAAGILLNDLGLPNYFFENITKGSLKNLLASITSSIAIQEGKVVLVGRVAHIDFDLEQGNDVQRVRIATRETRDNMEKVLESLISGHRREYYFSPENSYYTYIIRPETVNDYTRNEFRESRFLFNLAGDYTATPEPTRRRYEKFLKASKASVSPLIEVFNLPVTGETRFMFNSDFASPQIPIFRKLFKDHGLTLMRAYWEPYWDSSDVPSSICSLYIRGELSTQEETGIIRDLCAFLSFSVNPVTGLYVQGKLTFKEMLFAGNAIDFTHMFIFTESEDATDREIMASLGSKEHEDAFAARIHKADRCTYGARTILSTAMAHPDLLKYLHTLFEQRFDPALAARGTDMDMEEKLREFNRIMAARFMDFPLGLEIFQFMAKLVTCTLKTNFYKPRKRSFSFRFDDKILDPLVYNQFVFAVFFVNGHYACGTHLRASDIARGGLRLLRITPANHGNELDNAVLLNFNLGPKAQRLKHKDICESGSTGVIVPHATYGKYAKDALYDYTEGILDLMLADDAVVDYYGSPEMLFFGPDQGTSALMDAVALQGKERGYPHWRTLTTGKSFGIPHDTYGVLDNGKLFGLLDAKEEGTDLQVNGKSVVVTPDMETIHQKIGGKIQTCGMTTTGVMAAFRTLISHYNAKEKDLNLMMIGGPDGDLGANELLCYQGRICLVMDNAAVLFDPDGLDRKELEKIAFMRHTSPRPNALAFPVEKLSPQGFKVPVAAKYQTLPDGRVVEDGAVFLRDFLFDPANRSYMEQARIQAFIPCGGFKDTVNHKNVKTFLDNFRELRFIVEGANLFFDDASRRYMATGTGIKQIKDATASKGGVFSSSIAEVLTGFLLKDEYEEKLLNDIKTRGALIRDIMALVEIYSCAETDMLIRIHKNNPARPLFTLSDKAGEEILALQAVISEKLNHILKQKSLVWKIMEAYVPKVLIKTLGKKKIMAIFNSDDMQVYRDAIITKKLASMAFYRFGLEWDRFLDSVKTDFSAALNTIFK